MAAKKNSKNENNEKRVPIVSILGHVDHGKTTILDKIRATSVQLGEAGGITQKISVFTVPVNNNQDNLVTFIDTPGHEAFDLMRLRGGSIADIVLLIVAADDSVKPQTKESIEIIKNSPAKPIVVINKIDLPNVNVDKVKRDVTNEGLVLEGFGGNIPVVEVSGAKGTGIETLLETIATVAEIEGLLERGTLPEHATGKGYVLESVKDKSKGFVASVVNVLGEFQKGDWLVYRKGTEVIHEKIKGFISEENSNIEMFAQGHGGKILGLSSAIELGTEVYVTDDNSRKSLKELFDAVEVKEKEAESQIEEEALEGEDADNALLTAMFSEIQTEEDEKKKLNVIIRSSSEGSLEAIKKSLERLDVEGHKVNIIDAGIGDVSANDIDQASITKAIVLAFEVSVNNDVLAMAKDKKVLLRQYEIIYKLSEEVSDALTLLATPQEVEEDLGSADIKAIFVLSDGSKVLGGRVKEGVIKRNEKCYIVRDDEILGEARIKTLKHGKNEINEAQKGSDFGAILDVNVEAKEGDEIHCFKVVKMTF